MTPLQMVNAVNAIATGGELMRPYLVSRITSSSGELILQNRPGIVRRVISEDTARKVTRMMETVTETGGSGTRAAIEGFTGRRENRNSPEIRSDEGCLFQVILLSRPLLVLRLQGIRLLLLSLSWMNRRMIYMAVSWQRPSGPILSRRHSNISTFQLYDQEDRFPVKGRKAEPVGPAEQRQRDRRISPLCPISRG